jgi:hypothetical protein
LSRESIVQAYLRGEISRRTFIRRLVATGVSLSAAVSYTQLLTPEWARAAVVSNCELYEQYGLYQLYDLYCDGEQQPPTQQPGDGTQQQQQQQQQQQDEQKQEDQPTTTVVDTRPPVTDMDLVRLSLATVLLTGRFLISFATNEPADVTFVATTTVADVSSSRRVVVGRARKRFRRAGRRRVAIKLTRPGFRLLRRRRRRRQRVRITVTSTARDATGNVRRRRLRFVTR